MIRTASQVVAERVIWAASGPPLGAWAGAHGWSMFSHRRFEVSDAAPASKDFPAGAHELGRKTFPRWADLFLSAAQQSLSLWNIASAELWIAKCGSMGGWMNACTTREPMANSLHLFARRRRRSTHTSKPNSHSNLARIQFESFIISTPRQWRWITALVRGFFNISLAMNECKASAFNSCQSKELRHTYLFHWTWKEERSNESKTPIIYIIHVVFHYCF